jgi:chlorosome envelope protein J
MLCGSLYPSSEVDTPFTNENRTAMIIYINDRPCEAEVGDLLLATAKLNKAHIGYICGGNGICQSCFVYVREGADCLSQPSDEEKAFISDKLFQEGGRLACQTVIIKEGSVRVVTRAETLKRIVLGLNIPGFITYAQTIGYNVVNKLPSGASNVFTRFREGKLNPVETLGKIASGLGPASLLAVDSFSETFSFMQGPISLAAGGAKGLLDTASGALCTVTGGRVHLPGTTCAAHDSSGVAIERVKITARP